MNVKLEESWNGKTVKVRGKKAIGRSAFEIGLIIEGQAKRLTPVKYGYLRGSITTQTNETGTALENVNQQATGGKQPDRFQLIEKPNADGEVYVGTAVEYAMWVEFGTKKAPAQPFLRPARDLAQGKALTIVENEGRKEFREYLE